MTNSTSCVLIRRGVVADADALQWIAKTTFSETFGHLYSRDDLQAYLDKACSVKHCRDKLVDQRMAVWFAIIDVTELAGFIVAGPCKLPVNELEPGAGEIQQLYVLSQYQNQRIGTRLMDTALAWLASAGHAPLYVGVWSENFGAQRLYARYGFNKVGEYDFPVGQTIDREFILKR